MRRRIVVTVIVALGLLLAPGDSRVDTRAAGLPASLTDHDFWQMIVDSSEPNGYFRNENLTSNELGFQVVIPDLVARTRKTSQPGAYLGVGPEQNFTYITAVRPAIAIIFDIRRGNMLLQLMYKALFELSRDRADFVSLLFSRRRPAGLGPKSSDADLFSSFGTLPASQAAYAQNLKAMKDQLTKMHHLPLTDDDLYGIEHVYETFYSDGFKVRYSPTYDELMTAADESGEHRSYLASESGFQFLKNLQSKNLVVPVVGDFGGPKAIRRIGAYLRAHGATVSAFYLSNVEQYLSQDGKESVFCRNIRSLPLDDSSTFIRSSSRFGGYGFGRGFVSSLGEMQQEAKSCQ